MVQVELEKSFSMLDRLSGRIEKELKRESAYTEAQEKYNSASEEVARLQRELDSALEHQKSAKVQVDEFPTPASIDSGFFAKHHRFLKSHMDRIQKEFMLLFDTLCSKSYIQILPSEVNMPNALVSP